MEAENQDLKRKRSARKSVLTRKCNELKRLIAEDLHEEVLAKYTSIREHFKQFEDAHDSFHDRLTDDDDIEESNAYFIETESDYTRHLTDVKSYIKTRDNPNLASNKKCSCSTDSKVSVLKLPSVPKQRCLSEILSLILCGGQPSIL